MKKKTEKMIMAALLIGVFIFIFFNLPTSNANNKYAFPADSATIIKQIKAVGKNRFSFSLNQRQLDKINAILRTRTAMEYKTEGELLEKVDPKFFDSLPLIVKEDLFHKRFGYPDSTRTNILSKNIESFQSSQYEGFYRVHYMLNSGMTYGFNPNTNTWDEIGIYGEAKEESVPAVTFSYMSASSYLYKTQPDGSQKLIASKYVWRPFTTEADAKAQSNYTSNGLYTTIGDYNWMDMNFQKGSYELIGTLNWSN